jgi:hypothetical protein
VILVKHDIPYTDVLNRFDMSVVKVALMTGDGSRTVCIPSAAVFERDLLAGMSPDVKVMAMARRLVNGEKIPFQEQVAALSQAGISFSNLKHPITNTACYTYLEASCAMNHVLDLKNSRVLKYLRRGGTLPFPMAPPNTRKELDGIKQRGFFIDCADVDNSVGFWCLHLCGKKGVFDHWYRMKSELNYCIGAPDSLFLPYKSVCLTTAEYMLVRAICRAVEENATKERNHEALTRFAWRQKKIATSPV